MDECQLGLQSSTAVVYVKRNDKQIQDYVFEIMRLVFNDGSCSTLAMEQTIVETRICCKCSSSVIAMREITHAGSGELGSQAQLYVVCTVAFLLLVLG